MLKYLNFIWNKIKDSTLYACTFTGAAYFFLRLATHTFAEGTEYTFVIHPSIGIAVALTLILGTRVWPGILIGSFLAYLNAGSLDLVASVTLGWALLSCSTTLQIFLAAFLVQKFNCLPGDFSNPGKNLTFYFFAGFLPSLINSTLAIIIQMYFERPAFNTYFNDWVFIWIGDMSSVVIFTSLAFCLMAFSLRRKIIVSSLLLFSFVMAEGIHRLGHNWDHERLDLIFQQQTAALTDSIENANEHYRSILQIMESLRTTPGGTTRESFKSFADTVLPYDPTILTVNWNAHVPREQVSAFDQILDQEYEQDIFVGETVKGIRVPLTEKDNYVIVRYIEPYETYYMAVGGDLNVNNMRSDALRYTAENRTPSMTSPIILDSGQIPTIVSMYLASFDGDKLMGYNTMLLSLSNMLNDILAKPFSQDLDLAVTDKEALDGLTTLFNSNNKLDLSASDFNLDIPMFNRVWTVDLYKKPEFYARHASHQPFLIGFGVMLTASFLAFVVATMSGHGIYLQKLVNKRTEELDKANKTKASFMANMSHDLRTPLNAIIGFSHIMKNQMYGKLNNEKYRDYIDNINNASQYLLTLINDILDLSAIEANKRKLTKTDVNIEETIKKCHENLYPLSNEKSINCTYNIPEHLPYLYADERAIKQILVNLISNAIKFTGNNGKIVTSATFDDDKFYISVEDNGEGISEENIERILTPFTRVENNPHLSHEGTGLGLSIVNSLVKLHSGDINFESELHKGTKITLTFPRENSKIVQLKFPNLTNA